MLEKESNVTIEVRNLPPEKVAELRRAIDETFRGSSYPRPQILDSGMTWQWSIVAFFRWFFGIRHKV